MTYYTIQSDKILMAETEQALSNFYNNIKILPDDYVEGKYILDNNMLVLNPDFEAEQVNREREIRVLEIKSQLVDLDAQAIRPLRAVLTDCGTDEDREILKDIEMQANNLRAELSSFL